MLTLDEPQTHTKTQTQAHTRNGTPNGATTPEAPTAARPTPSVQQPPSLHPTPDSDLHSVSLSPNQIEGLCVSSPSPDDISHKTRTAIQTSLLHPDANPHDIAEDYNLPLQAILDIYESEETQTLLSRLERMQQRRAEYHINFSKPLAARNLTDILEQSINEEITCHHRETPEATTLRWRRRETTRRVAMAVLKGWPLGTPPLRGGRNSTSATTTNVQTPQPFAPISHPPSLIPPLGRSAPKNDTSRTSTPPATRPRVTPLATACNGAFPVSTTSTPAASTVQPSTSPVTDEAIPHDLIAKARSSQTATRQDRQRRAAAILRAACRTRAPTEPDQPTDASRSQLKNQPRQSTPTAAPQARSPPPA